MSHSLLFLKTFENVKIIFTVKQKQLIIITQNYDDFKIIYM